MLPDKLQNAILNEAEKIRLKDLTKARENLTSRYKGARSSSRLMQTTEEKLSYLVTRMPATFAAVSASLQNLANLCPHLNPKTILDVGAGPGTASWAAFEHDPSLRRFTLLEQDEELVKLGKALAEGTAMQDGEWLQGDITSRPSLAPHDLVICSYALGEIPSHHRDDIVAWMWTLADQALLIVEPGSREGFDTIRKARDVLIASGARIAAPCPHALACPMPADNWCHFSVRLERTWAHRYLKSGTLSYEDEKFSYVAATKLSVHPFSGRIISHPEKHSGHLRLRICGSDGKLEMRTFSKKNGEDYKRAKKMEWGSCCNDNH